MSSIVVFAASTALPAAAAGPSSTSRDWTYECAVESATLARVGFRVYIARSASATAIDNILTAFARPHSIRTCTPHSPWLITETEPYLEAARRLGWRSVLVHRRHAPAGLITPSRIAEECVETLSQATEFILAQPAESPRGRRRSADHWHASHMHSSDQPTASVHTMRPPWRHSKT